MSRDKSTNLKLVPKLDYKALILFPEFTSGNMENKTQLETPERLSEPTVTIQISDDLLHDTTKSSQEIHLTSHDVSNSTMTAECHPDNELQNGENVIHGTNDDIQMNDASLTPEGTLPTLPTLINLEEAFADRMKKVLHIDFKYYNNNI